MKFSDLYTKLIYEVDSHGQFISVSIAGISRREYNSLRVQLVRKFNAQAETETTIGIDRFSGMYMACTFRSDESDTGVASFCVKDKSTSKCQPRTYNVVDI